MFTYVHTRHVKLLCMYNHNKHLNPYPNISWYQAVFPVHHDGSIFNTFSKTKRKRKGSVSNSFSSQISVIFSSLQLSQCHFHLPTLLSLPRTKKFDEASIAIIVVFSPISSLFYNFFNPHEGGEEKGDK